MLLMGLHYVIGCAVIVLYCTFAIILLLVLLYAPVRITEFKSERLRCLGVMPSKHHIKPDIDLEDHLQQHRT